MNFKSRDILFVLVLALTFCSYTFNNAYSGTQGAITYIGETDSLLTEDIFPLVAFFDLRERESFIQVTNASDDVANVHVQIFNVAQNCNENDFFDLYTGNDTHVYNIRDIITNDGNSSGVVLPENSYGFVTFVRVSQEEFVGNSLIGNFRILDNAGYEYRTNMQFSALSLNSTGSPPTVGNYNFNFNKEAGVNLSDIVVINLNTEFEFPNIEVVTNPVEDFKIFDVDIINNNEVIFSCRNVVFSCINQDSIQQEALFENVSETTQGSSNVADFEYGINESIQHSRGGELLCPGNVITEGVVSLKQILYNQLPSPIPQYYAYVGLNNGNGRGSMDSINADNACLFFPPFCDNF